MPNVLVIDDDKAIRRLLELIAEDEGYHCTDTAPDLIICGLNGNPRRLLTLYQNYPDVPLVVLTSEPKHLAGLPIVYRHVPKPFELADVERLLREYADRQ